MIIDVGSAEAYALLVRPQDDDTAPPQIGWPVGQTEHIELSGQPRV